MGTKRSRLPPDDGGWLEHPVHKGYYGRPDGEVYSSNHGRVVKGYLQNGYVTVSLGKGKRAKRHRFNYEVATGETLERSYDIDHIESGIEPNDAWSNLQKLTSADNPGKGRRIAEALGKSIYARNVASGVVLKFNSVFEASRQLSIHRLPIHRCLNGTISTTSGYVFSYAKQGDEQKNDRDEQWKDCMYRDEELEDIRVSNRGAYRG
jgi:hypothetical protein